MVGPAYHCWFQCRTSCNRTRTRITVSLTLDQAVTLKLRTRQPRGKVLWTWQSPNSSFFLYLITESRAGIPYAGKVAALLSLSETPIPPASKTSNRIPLRGTLSKLLICVYQLYTELLATQGLGESYREATRSRGNKILNETRSRSGKADRICSVGIHGHSNSVLDGKPSEELELWWCPKASRNVSFYEVYDMTSGQNVIKPTSI